MRFKYSTTSPSQNEFDSLPRIPLILKQGDRIVETVGLVDSGATINVLPYEIGLQLGNVWDERKSIIRLTGNLGNQQAIPFSLVAQIGEFEPVKLVFAWTNSPKAPVNSWSNQLFS
ncbi:MAG: hypothetical protein WCO45_01180 [Pseudanabaena sp. ELA607]|jgi:hypothetical protein